jgi:hypothetical protein
MSVTAAGIYKSVLLKALEAKVSFNGEFHYGVYKIAMSRETK